MAHAAPQPGSARSFYVHDRSAGRHTGHLVREAEDFPEAAVAFAQDWAAAQAGDLSVIVKDCETGEEQCFVVDLGEGEAEPC